MSNISRKEFLVKSSKTAVGVAAIAGMSSLITTANVNANPLTTWPWPYQQLDPDEVRAKAHFLYWNDKDCCAGTFGGILQAIQEKLPDPWNNIPMEIMLFGRGGGNGWGTLCGSINGGAAFISLVTDKAASGPLISELWGWYAQADLPTDTANEFATSNKYLITKFADALPQNVSGSPLCHVSVTEWCMFSNKKISDLERKERCARVTGDCAAKTVELLNQHFAGQFTPTYVDPDSIKACLGCHGTNLMNNVMTKLECTSCHGDPHSASAVEKISPVASTFVLSQNYPNPFNPLTKIHFSIANPEKVKLEVYDITGNLVSTLIDYDLYQTGSYQVEWDGRNSNGSRVSSGIYFAKMQAGKFQQTRKMNLVK